MRDEIFTTLRDEILTGDLKPGEALREIPLSERFGVSRTPVRDALSRLEEAGLAQRNNRGLEVRGVDPEAVIHVYDLRILLEQEAAGQAALRRSLTDILELEALIERDRNLEERTDQRMVETNLEFHRRLWRSTQNPVLIELLERLSTHFVHTPQSTLGTGTRFDDSLDEHAALIRAIQERDEALARRLAKDHLTTARGIRLDLLRAAAIEEISENCEIR